MTYCSNKDINRLVRDLLGNGWTYVRMRKHGRLNGRRYLEIDRISALDFVTVFALLKNGATKTGNSGPVCRRPQRRY